MLPTFIEHKVFFNQFEYQFDENLFEYYIC